MIFCGWRMWPHSDSLLWGASMKLAARLCLALFLLGSSGVLLTLQGRHLRSCRDDQDPGARRAEFAFTRLRYPTRGGNAYGNGGYGFGGYGGFGSFRPNNGWSE